jgi:hypothetical protein
LFADDNWQDKADVTADAVALGRDNANMWLPGMTKNSPPCERFCIDIARSVRFYDPLMMTPLSVVDSILALHDKPPEFIKEAGFDNLTLYVRETTRPDGRPDSMPLFRAAATGASRCTQVYVCACCADCPAHFTIRMYQSGMGLGHHQFKHSHEIDHRTVGPYHTFRPEVIQEIIRLTREHATLGHIRTVLDLHATANPVYGVRRKPLEKQRQRQAEALAEVVSTWRGWSCEWAPVVNGEFRGFYAVNDRIISHPMCRAALGMDDTPCMTYFDMPVSAIITEDPNDTTQLVAFAILYDQKAETLQGFLRFVRGQMGGDQPRAFVMDRARGETKAVGEEFPGSRICYCQVHIFRNIQLKCGKQSELATRFWPAMRGNKQAQVDYQGLLEEAFRKLRNQPGKRKMRRCIKGLLVDWEHWATYCTELYTRMNTTGRNEGFNGNAKNFVDHRVMTLEYVANAWRLLGEMAFRRSQQMRTHFIPFGILSREDQRFIGSIALRLILEQMLYLMKHQREWHVRTVEYTGKCCESCHWLYEGLPCCHLLRARHVDAQQRPGSHVLRYYLADDFKGEPLLTRKDIPAQCLRVLSCLRCTGRAPARPIPASAPSDFDPVQAAADCQAFLKVCEESQEARREWHRFRHGIDHLISNPGHRDDEPDGTLHDPPRRRVAGQPGVHPSRNSPLCFLK